MIDLNMLFNINTKTTGLGGRGINKVRCNGSTLFVNKARSNYYISGAEGNYWVDVLNSEDFDNVPMCYRVRTTDDDLYLMIALPKFMGEERVHLQDVFSRMYVKSVEKVKLNDSKLVSRAEAASLFSEGFVSVCRGANSSVLPVLALINDGDVCSRDIDYTISIDGLKNMSVANWARETMTKISEALPPVDLSISDILRYAVIHCDGRDYLYNRNHVAYNGNIESLHALAPVLFSYLGSGEVPDAGIVSYFDWFCGKIEADEVVLFEDKKGTWEKPDIVEADKPNSKKPEVKTGGSFLETIGNMTTH